MRIYASAAFAFLLIFVVTGNVRAGIKLGINVEDADEIWGARIRDVSPNGSAATMLKLRPGDVIRYIRVDDGPRWTTPHGSNAVGALRLVRNRAVIDYLRGGKLYRVTAKVALATSDASEEGIVTEASEAEPIDDPSGS